MLIYSAVNITWKGFAAKFVKWGALLCSDIAIDTPVLTLNDKSKVEVFSLISRELVKSIP